MGMEVVSLLRSWHPPGVARALSLCPGPLLRFICWPVRMSMWFPTDFTPHPNRWELMLADKGAKRALGRKKKEAEREKHWAAEGDKILRSI